MNYWGSEKQPFWRPGDNLTVDIVVIHRGRVLLIKRGEEPFRGFWALPGGFHETGALPGEHWRSGKETAKAAALRELEEETSIPQKLSDQYIEPLAIFDRFGRDPRDNDEAWSISQVFCVRFPDDLEIPVTSGDDANDACWFLPDEIQEIAFDHREMLLRAGFLKD